MSRSTERVDRLRESIVADGLDALLVTEKANVRYLSGFTGTNGTLLIDPDDAYLLTDFRYVEQVADQAPDFD
ncbi:MAG: aminopeptidase P family N-terminal domain-containing protein, partial [Solirubrobacterales bacterium]